MSDETIEEIEDRLAGGGPSWEAALAGVCAGESVGEALERAGIPRMRYRGWLRRWPVRGKEMALAEEVRDEREKEEVMREVKVIARAGMDDVSVKDKLAALGTWGKQVGMKEGAVERVADSLETILARVAQAESVGRARIHDEVNVPLNIAQSKA
jgi:hypothetical protein